MKAPKATTKTKLPPAREGRYRATWGNSLECTHRWAANDTPEGRAGNVFFRDGTIYSYGNHFPMARWVELKDKRVVVFLTTRTHSVTTASHLSDVRRAIPAGAEVFRVHDVTADYPHEHRQNFDAMVSEAKDLIARAAKARQRKAEYLGQAAGRINAANEYAEAVRLPKRNRVAVPGGDLTKWAADAAEAKKAAEAAEEKRLRKGLAKKVKEWEEKLAAWQAGGDEHPGHCPSRFDPRHGLAFIRVRGTRLETTERAVVPLAAALPILESLRTGNPLPDDFKVDGFALLGIDREKRLVTIGCHRVEFAEIDRAAKVAGL